MDFCTKFKSQFTITGFVLSLKSITFVSATFNTIVFAFNQKESSFKSLFRLQLILEILL